MSEENGKSKTLVWAKLAVLALLLVTGGFTLTGCPQAQPGGEATEQEGENQQGGQEEGEDDDDDEGGEQQEGEDNQDDDDPE